MQKNRFKTERGAPSSVLKDSVLQSDAKI
jgi:hypothetical protein